MINVFFFNKQTVTLYYLCFSLIYQNYFKSISFSLSLVLNVLIEKNRLVLYKDNIILNIVPKTNCPGLIKYFKQ